VVWEGKRNGMKLGEFERSNENNEIMFAGIFRA
jgi:hypothetical protein